MLIFRDRGKNERREGLRQRPRKQHIMICKKKKPWWWILCVNIKLCWVGQRMLRLSGKSLFLCVSRRVFLEETSISIGELPNTSGYYPICWGPENKRWTKTEFTLPDWAGTSIFSCPECWHLDLIWHLHHCFSLKVSELYHWLSCLSSLQQADHGPSKPP